MIAHKAITKLIAVAMVLAVCACVLAVGFSGRIATAAGETGITMEYETALFDTDTLLTVNILMDETEFDQMLENAMSEEYYACDVEIGGQTFYRVGIRPKGNTSLSSIVSDPTTDRYSFKLEFDHYVDGQTCFGLDKLVLNNNYADATNMKEALVYDMYQFLGADASLYNYASISVNGEYWGVYLALEAVEDSFLLRNYGVQSGALYKPEGMQMGGGNGGGRQDPGGEMPDFADLPDGMEPPEDWGDFDPSQFFTAQPGEEQTAPDVPDTPDVPDASQSAPTLPGSAPDVPGDVPDMPDEAQRSPDGAPSMPDGADADAQQPEGFGGMGGFPFEGEAPNGGGPAGGFSGGGADLNYTDDDLGSYETIWDGSVGKTSDADHRRVVTALEHASSGEDLETYLDVDNLLRYLAVHVFSVNEDSLTGSMAHNYYLYEYDGKINLLPWDYNLAFGGMGGGSDASSVVNDPIYGPFSGTAFFDALLENEEYRARYESYLQQLVDEYVTGGGFAAFYQRVRGQIDALVEADPTAFYSYDAYEAAAQTLYQVVSLRGASIAGQLRGSIPSTQDAQRGSDALVDASGLDLSVMGSMNMGGGFTRGDGGDDFRGHGGSFRGDAETTTGKNDTFEQKDAPRPDARGEMEKTAPDRETDPAPFCAYQTSVAK